MVTTSKKDFLLPEGLDLKFVSPDFLNNVWPVYILDSSMRSLLIVSSIFVVAGIIALVLAVIGRGMEGLKGKVFTGFFLLAAVFIGYTAYISISHWKSADSISEQALGTVNDATYTWLQSNGIKGNKDQSLALVCDYYQIVEKSRFCKSTSLTPKEGWYDRPLKMDTGVGGYMILIDSKNQIPLIEPDAKVAQ